MISREHFFASIEREFAICKHLHANLPEGALEYRHSPHQRSTLELLQYLSYIGVVSMEGILGDWSSYVARAERAATMHPADFPAAMDLQLEEMRRLFDTVADEEFVSRLFEEPNGDVVPIGVAFMRLTLSWMIGYRMQLFLHAKAAGNYSLGTSDNWYGVEWREEVETTDTLEGQA